MPLVVRPNVQRMRHMRESPSETAFGERGAVRRRRRWRQAAVIALIAAVVLVGLVLLLLHA